MEDTVLQAYWITDSGQAVLIDGVLDAGRPAFLIGSDPRSHLRLESADASHALVLRRQETYFIQPRLPNVPVLVNGKRISGPTCLLPGDQVQIGEALLRFDQREGKRSAPPPAPQPLLPDKQEVERAVVPPRPAPVVTRPAAASLASIPAAPETVVYYPKPAAQPGPNLGGVLLGLFTLLVIVGVVGYGIVTGLSTDGSVVAAGDLDFVYNDGNVTVLMFDADW
ncbi:MAG: hypothetical protein HZC41_16085 [Chloroflexi bacterium]|nr:hypothetical protein [Chloroflexota bacterium]